MIQSRDSLVPDSDSGTNHEYILHNLERWLRRLLLKNASVNLLAAVMFFVTGALVFGFVAYAIAFVSALILLRLTALLSLFDVNIYLLRTPTILLLWVLFVASSFAGAYKARYGLEYSDHKVSFWSPAASAGVLRALANLVCDVLFSGPRLLFLAASHCSRMRRQIYVSTQEIAMILLWLYERGRKSTALEISRAFPLVNAVRTLPQLRDVPGVIWLHRDGGVIILSQEMKDQLGSILGYDQPVSEGKQEEPPNIASEPVCNEAAHWYLALGLPPFAPMVEVKRRYRQLVRRWHPDIVRSQNPQGIEEAEASMKRINEAYDSIAAANSKEK